MAYLKNNYRVKEERLKIQDIPVIRLIPEGYNGKYPTIIFYHGLGSNKDNQRIRGYILASFGYQVLLPDAPYHGERAVEETEDMVLVYKYFYRAILQSIEESNLLTSYLIDEADADPNKIFASGHSMGGYTSVGVLTHNSKFKAAVPMNGSLNWEASNRIMKKDFGIDPDYMVEEDYLAIEYSPSNNLSKLKDKEILILSGELDDEVDITPQREFYIENKNKINVDFIEQEGVGHFVTTGMLEQLIAWLGEK